MVFTRAWRNFKRMQDLTVLAACLIFGSGFAFYAMFAAIAVELIGAVYYTFQLK